MSAPCQFPLTGPLPLPRPFPLRVEVRSRRRHLPEDPRGLEARREAPVQHLQRTNHRWNPERVEIAEGASAKGRKADPVHGAYIAIARARDDPLLQTARRLVQHREYTSLHDVARTDQHPLPRAREERIHALVHPLLLPALVAIEATPALPPRAPGLDHLCERDRRHHPVAERAEHHRPRLPRDVEPCLLYTS